MKDMLDVNGAASYLRLAKQTLNKLRSVGGSPPYYKAGRRVLYDRAELDRWLDARRRRSTSDQGARRETP